MKLFIFALDDVCDTENFIVLAETEQQGRELILAEYAVEHHELMNKNMRIEREIDLAQAKPELFASIPQSWD